MKILLGPLSGILVGYGVYLLSNNDKIGFMTATACWMAVWWVVECVPLAVTSMLPVFLFPFTGLMSTAQVASVYMNDVLFLFVGGFMMSFAMERWNLHRRIALHIILKIGTDGSRLLLGLMLCTFLISMWMSNTATTMMMIPTTMALIGKIHDLHLPHYRNVAKGLLLGIAYASTVGGVATIVGTPTNMIFYSFYQQEFSGQTQLTFLTWFLFGLPVALLMLLATYVTLKKIYLGRSDLRTAQIDRTIVVQELHQLGKISFEEKAVAWLFVLLVILWFTRADLQVGSLQLKGWSHLFKYPQYIHDGAVAVLMSLFLFIVPAKKEQTTLLTWEDAKKLPYSVLLLFGGGFALARGFDDSGLTSWLASQLTALKHLPLVVIVACVSLFITAISEFASNMATIQLCLPIISALCLSTGVEPLLLMIPATCAASYAFMMPVGTAPNTIIFASEQLKTADMMRPGFFLNLIGVFIITLMTFTWGRWIFNI